MVGRILREARAEPARLVVVAHRSDVDLVERGARRAARPGRLQLSADEHADHGRRGGELAAARRHPDVAVARAGEGEVLADPLEPEPDVSLAGYRLEARRQMARSALQHEVRVRRWVVGHGGARRRSEEADL